MKIKIDRKKEDFIGVKKITINDDFIITFDEARMEIVINKSSMGSSQIIIVPHVANEIGIK